MNPSIARFMTTLLIILMLVGVNAAPALAQEEADLALTKTADRTNVKVGQNITFTITVTNLGPAVATGVYFGDSLPDPLNFVSASCTKGPAYGGPCAVDSLAVGESATITLVATPISNPAKSERRFTNTAFIAQVDQFDPNTSNNTPSLNLHIIGKTH